jgi:hypothetical protein
MSDESSNSNLRPWIDPKIEARIVALVLGEASDFEREELERLIAENRDFAAYRQRIESVHGLIEGVVGGSQPSNADLPLELPTAMQDELLAAFETTPSSAISEAAAANDSPFELDSAGADSPSATRATVEPAPEKTPVLARLPLPPRLRNALAIAAVVTGMAILGSMMMPVANYSRIAQHEQASPGNDDIPLVGRMFRGESNRISDSDLDFVSESLPFDVDGEPAVTSLAAMLEPANSNADDSNRRAREALDSMQREATPLYALNEPGLGAKNRELSEHLSLYDGVAAKGLERQHSESDGKESENDSSGRFNFSLGYRFDGDGAVTDTKNEVEGRPGNNLDLASTLPMPTDGDEASVQIGHGGMDGDGRATRSWSAEGEKRVGEAKPAESMPIDLARTPDVVSIEGFINYDKDLGPAEGEVAQSRVDWTGRAKIGQLYDDYDNGQDGAGNGANMGDTAPAEKGSVFHRDFPDGASDALSTGGDSAANKPVSKEPTALAEVDSGSRGRVDREKIGPKGLAEREFEALADQPDDAQQIMPDGFSPRHRGSAQGRDANLLAEEPLGAGGSDSVLGFEERMARLDRPEMPSKGGEDEVIQLGKQVDTNGSIGAVDGTVALGVGGERQVSQAGDAKIRVLSSEIEPAEGMSNPAGEIRGGQNELKAQGNGYTGAVAINANGGINGDVTIVGGGSTAVAPAPAREPAVVWSDSDTAFGLVPEVAGGGEVGSGGRVEVSGKRNVTFGEDAEAEAKAPDSGVATSEPAPADISFETPALATAPASPNQNRPELLITTKFVEITDENKEGFDWLLSQNGTADSDADMAADADDFSASAPSLAAVKLQRESGESYLREQINRSSDSKAKPRPPAPQNKKEQLSKKRQLSPEQATDKQGWTNYSAFEDKEVPLLGDLPSTRTMFRSNPVTAGNRSGDFPASDDSIDGLIAPVVGTEAAAPTDAPVVFGGAGVFTDPQREQAAQALHRKGEAVQFESTLNQSLWFRGDDETAKSIADTQAGGTARQTPRAGVDRKPSFASTATGTTWFTQPAPASGAAYYYDTRDAAEISGEFIYPTEFDPPETPNSPAAASGASSAIADSYGTEYLVDALPPVIQDDVLATNLRRDLLRRDLERQRSPVPAGLAETATSDEPFSTFSLHVSDVSFTLAQTALEKGEWPEAERIRVEEFVNAFDYGDPLPSLADKVACEMEQSIHPFLQQRNLLRLSMRTAAAGRSQTTPLSLTLVLDHSGSMERHDRQQTVQRAFAQLTDQLSENDTVSVLGFARQPRLLVDRATGNARDRILAAVAETPSEGGTNLESALDLAFEKAREQASADGQNRVILLTDGAANLGNADPERLAQKVHTMREAGIAFDAAGIGADGLNDEILEALTRKGDGRYYLLDQPEDADEGFARQIAGALRPAAMNVKVQIEFNPDRVASYKLLGFEKHRLKKEDFRNDQVDAAEIAAEEAGVAVYQFEPLADGKGDVGTAFLRFRDMSTRQMVEKRWPIAYAPDAPRPDQASPKIRLATVAALFAAKLKGDALGEAVDLTELRQLIDTLPAQLRNLERVQQLRTMIDQAREM